MSSLTEAAARAAPEPRDAELQALLAQAVRRYAQRAEQGEAPAAFAPDAQITATEVLVTISAMCKAVKLQVFELGIWQSWSEHT